MIPDPVTTFWQNLSTTQQDAAVFVALLLPALVVGIAVVAGYRPYGLVSAMMWRFKWTNLLFVLLIGASVGIGVGLIAQERGLRQGTARAADKFDLIVAAPGSEMTMLLAAVYLQPSDVPLVSGEIYEEIASHERVDIAAPIAFGDSWEGAPVVGTIPDFVDHLSGGLTEGRVFETTFEAVAGARVDLPVGAGFEPSHGLGDAVEGVHEGVEYTVVGRMPMTGSPWDKALLVPVEGVWQVHNLPIGHGPEWDGTVGPPFEAEHFPGTPAVLVRAEQLWANYALRSEFQRDDVMAFFPGAVLAQLHALMGDVRQVMSVLAVVTQVLVTAGVLTGLLILVRLYSQRLALLRALGAPARFAFAVVWSYAAALIAAGALLGLVVGYGATQAISRLVTQRTDILVTTQLAWPELHLVAGFVSLTIILALLPAFTALSRDVVRDLRG
jgi:putative ABC transport system permease protein